MVRRLALITALAACGDETVTIAPVIDGPVDADATVFPDLDAITISVAHAGDTEDLVSHTFARGEPLELAGVPFADDLVIHMSGRIGASEIAYGRTCLFAAGPGITATPHLFFSRSVKFAQLALDTAPRSGGQAITYHDGGAIILGGSSTAVERFEPETGAFEQIADVAPRTDAVAAELGVVDPRIVLIGGNDGGTGAGYVELVEADNPPLRRVEKISNIDMARVDLTATSLTDGRIIAIGGRAPGSVAVGTINEVRESAGTIEVRKLLATLATKRALHTATRLGDDVGAPVLIVGGIDDTGAPVATAELFKPLSEELADPLRFAPQLNIPRSRHRAALMPDGSVLVIGGVDAAGAPIYTLELFSIDTGFVIQDIPLPASSGTVDFTATPLPDGRILIAGGRDAAGNPVATAHIARLDPLDGQVTIVATDDLGVPRAGHQATLLCDGTVLITGGTDGASFAERYNPPPLSRR